MRSSPATTHESAQRPRLGQRDVRERSTASWDAEATSPPMNGVPSQPKWSPTGDRPQQLQACLPVRLKAADPKQQAAQQAAPTHKPRKRTAQMHKMTVQALEDEAKMLSGELSKLKKKRTITKADPNAVLREAVLAQSQELWTAHSLFSDWMSTQAPNPISSFIHLPRNTRQRRAKLLSLKAPKLHSALEFLNTRSQFLDPLTPYRLEGRSGNAQGDFGCSMFDIVQFPGVKSVRQVYDAIMHHLFFLEISVAEQLGEITVRNDVDDDSLDRHSIYNYRLVSCDDDRHGVQQETSCVAFAQYYTPEDPDNDLPGQEWCLMATDFVDRDDLHPYSPSLYLRRDHSSAMTLTTHRRKKIKQQQREELLTGGEEPDELVVVLKRAVFLKLHHSDLNVDERVLESMRDGLMGWNNLMVAGIRERVYSHLK